MIILPHIFMYLDILDNGQKDERFREDPDPKTKGYKADEQQVSTLIENLHVVIISRLYVYRGRSKLIYSFANVFFIQIYKFRQLLKRVWRSSKNLPLYFYLWGREKMAHDLHGCYYKNCGCLRQNSTVCAICW